MMELKNIINSIITSSEKETQSQNNYQYLIENIKEKLTSISDIADICNNLKQKYSNKIDQYTSNFTVHIDILNKLIENSKLKDFSFLTHYSTESFLIEEKDKQKYKEINDKLDLLIAMLKDLLFETFKWSQLFHFITLFFRNDLFRSKEFIRERTVYKRKYEEFKITVDGKINLDCLLILSDDHDQESKKNIVIISGPNLTSMEHLLISWNIDGLYLLRNTDTLFWNYRGYGFSEGSANFNNVKSDVEKIYDYLVTQNRWDKIGIHGLSVGGIPSCHLGKVKKIDLVIADRTFGSTNTIISILPCGIALHYFAKILMIPDVDNALDFLQTKCFKILLNDANDKTINDRISLKSEISRTIIKKIFNSHLNELNYKGIQTGNILDYALNIEYKKKFIDDFKTVINFLKDYRKKGTNDSLKTNSISKIDIKEKDYEDNLVSFDNVGEDSSYSLFKELRTIYRKFNSCGDSLENFISCELGMISHLNVFLNNFVIYGAYIYNNSIDIEDENYEVMNYVKNCVPVLFEFIEKGEELLQLKDIKKNTNLKIYESVKGVIEAMKTFKNFVQSMKIEEFEDNWLKMEKGNLVPLNCGHISFYDDQEYNTMVKLLEKEFFSV